MKIAVCGLIGSGKSEVLKLIRELNYNTIDLDKINNDLINDIDYISLVEQTFPMAVIDKKINKSKLSNIIFSNNEDRLKLNKIAHPIIKKILNQLTSNTDETYFIETPLLIEASMENFFDKIIYIQTNYQTQIDRLISRNSITRELAIKKINTQSNELKAKQIADLIIDNDTDLSSLKKIIDNKIVELLK